MKLRILVLFSVMLFAFTACKKDSIDTVAIENKLSKDSVIRLDMKEVLVLAPKTVGRAISYQWLENDVQVGTEASYKFSKESPGEHTVVFKVVNEGGISSLTYKIKVLGPYGKGVLLLSNGDEDIDGPSGLSYLDDKGNITNGVFELENPGQHLSPSAFNLYHQGNSYYITSMEGPNHLTVINDQTLKVEYTIKQSGIAGVTYFATTDGKTGYVNVTNRKKAGIYPVDLVRKSISGIVIPETKETPLIPIYTTGNSVVTSSGKQLLQIDNNIAKVLYTYEENVAGVVRTLGNTTWVGVQGFERNPKFVRLDQSLKAIEVVQLDPKEYRLPANGILTASGKDNFIYWQETNFGKICRFNIFTKRAEVFLKLSDEGIVMLTAWKVNPQNGDVYLVDTPGMFMGENESDLYIFDKNGKLKKEIKNVGYTVSDIAFPR